MNFEKSVIFIDRDKINYYDHNRSSALTFQFTKEFVNDLDVVNSAAFNLQIKSFIDNNKITPSQVMIVLSPHVYFEKEFSQTPEFHQDSELQKFVDTVPFENCSTKIYKLPTGSKLVATNADLYRAVKDAFEQAGFVIESVIPIFVLGKDVTVSDNLDVSIARIILERFDLAKQNTLLTNQNSYPKSQNKKDRTDMKSDNHTLILLLPILFVLVLVLIILYLKSYSPSVAPKSTPTPTIFINRVPTLPTNNFNNISSPSAGMNQNNTSTDDGAINQPKL